MNIFSFYRRATGEFIGRTFSGSLDDVDANTPEGCLAIKGAFDHLSQRVDLATGEVLDWRPPMPPDSDMESHAWDAENRRWTPVPTLKALKAHSAAVVRREIERIEAGQARALRDALLSDDEVSRAAALAWIFHEGRRSTLAEAI